MPPIIAAARATEGEMIAAMQEVFGTYSGVAGFLIRRSLIRTNCEVDGQVGSPIG